MTPSRPDIPGIGGAPPVILQAPASAGRDSVVEAVVLPGRGGMLLQATVQRTDGRREALLHTPSLDEAAARLDGGPDDFGGNNAFAFGGAILAPFANRIRGRALEGRREIETRIAGQPVRLPRNWGGKAPGAEQYAMHGLILDRRMEIAHAGPASLELVLDAGDFEGRWPGRTRLTVRWSLADGALVLEITAVNLGDADLPFGIGWHPYFRLPSGDRRQSRLHIPAASRVEVGDYDTVLPTGRMLPSYLSDAPLDDLYLDDCFTDLAAPEGVVRATLSDPAANYAVTLRTSAPPVRAIQVYAPPSEAFVVIEPQTHLADPFGEQWPPNLDTGMASIAPGAALAYRTEVRVGGSG